ncbi:MAG: glycosyltransferase family 4 protein [Nitrospiraceae bacterium]
MNDGQGETRAASTVGIDAGPLVGQGGISNYVGPLIRALVTNDPCTNWRLVLRRSWTDDQGAARLDELAPVIRVRTPDRILPLLWDRLEWCEPSQRRFWNSLDLYVATCLMAPVIPHGRVVSIVYDLIPLRLPELFPEHRTFRDRLSRLCQRSAALVAISQRTKQDLVEIMGVDPAMVHVVYPGLSETMQRPSVTHIKEVTKRYGIDGPYMLYVGSLGPHKNIATLLRAYQRVRDESKIDVKLVLVGSRQWGQATLVALNQLKVKNDVLLTGYVPAEDLPALYASAELFVFPSLYEGFGLPVLDAMACGTPVIVSTTGALPEVVGQAGVCVAPQDVRALAEAISRILGDTEFWGERSAAGLEQSKRFSWNHSAAQLQVIMKQVRDHMTVEA